MAGSPETEGRELDGARVPLPRAVPVAELPELFPSLRFGESEWLAVFTIRPDIMDAILDGMASVSSRWRHAGNALRWELCGKSGQLVETNEDVDRRYGITRW